MEKEQNLGGQLMKAFFIDYSLHLAVGCLSTLAGMFWKKMRKYKRDNDAIKLGLQAILGDKIFHLHEKYSERGSLTAIEQDMIDFMYSAYKAVDGNHGVDKMKKEIDKLPIKN